MKSTYEELSKTGLVVFWRVTGHIHGAIADRPRSDVHGHPSVTLHSRNNCSWKTHYAALTTRSDRFTHRAHRAGQWAARGRRSGRPWDAMQHQRTAPKMTQQRTVGRRHRRRRAFRRSALGHDEQAGRANSIKGRPKHGVNGNGAPGSGGERADKHRTVLSTVVSGTPDGGARALAASLERAREQSTCLKSIDACMR